METNAPFLPGCGVCTSKSAKTVQMSAAGTSSKHQSMENLPGFGLPFKASHSSFVMYKETKVETKQTPTRQSTNHEVTWKLMQLSALLTVTQYQPVPSPCAAGKIQN